MHRPIKIAHIIYQFDYGGMENGLANLVNHLPDMEFEHIIICLTSATDFRTRVCRPNVSIVELKKPNGKHFRTYVNMYSCLRRVQPDVVHTRNLGTIDMSWIARLAGCNVRVHGEHGWSADDPMGTSRKYLVLRRICDPSIARYVAVSRDIARWMTDVIGVAEDKVHCIHNGVDVTRFSGLGDSTSGQESPQRMTITFGTVGRQDPIKGLDILLDALKSMLDTRPDYCDKLRVILAGDGAEHERCKALRQQFRLDELVEMPGMVQDVPALVGQFDFFVQPSLNEGISNTILEAMASGLPVIATDVGGNTELIRDGIDGLLVKAGDKKSLQLAMETLIDDQILRQKQGEAAKQRVREKFSLDAMVEEYRNFYHGLVKTMSVQPA